MKDKKYSPSKFNVETASGKYPCRFPTFGEAKEFDEHLVKAKDPNEFIKEYFVKLGLPADAFMEMEYWQIKDLMGYFRDPLGNENLNKMK